MCARRDVRLSAANREVSGAPREYIAYIRALRMTNSFLYYSRDYLCIPTRKPYQLSVTTRRKLKKFLELETKLPAQGTGDEERPGRAYAAEPRTSTESSQGQGTGKAGD